jgi:hypothetical protein
MMLIEDMMNWLQRIVIRIEQNNLCVKIAYD